MQALPVRQATRLGAGPGFTTGRQQSGSGRLRSLGIRVHLELLDQRLALGRVWIKHTKAHQHIHGFGFGQVVFMGIRWRLGTRWQYQVLAALAFVRAGLAHVDDRPLPEIAHATGSRAWR
ncbi:hypothetical protein D3C72_1607920 [compost metagenome]